MGLGEKVEALLKGYRSWRLARLQGPFGDFFRAGGNEHLMAGIALREDDTAIDVGGFRGDWTADILCRFGCRVLTLEPVPAFQAELRKRFGSNSRVTLIDAGLSAQGGTVDMAIAGDSSGAFVSQPDPAKTFAASLLGVTDFWRDRKLSQVGCMKINIEGGEYDLLDGMLDAGLSDQVAVFLIQFHQNVPHCEARRQAIRERLARSHRNDLDYPFAWERWIRNS
jgi:FkbM family methyltransferase